MSTYEEVRVQIGWEFGLISLKILEVVYSDVDFSSIMLDFLNGVLLSRLEKGDSQKVDVFD